VESASERYVSRRKGLRSNALAITEAAGAIAIDATLLGPKFFSLTRSRLLETEAPMVERVRASTLGALNDI
jgi:hypothetical protein